jgi:hypothetical protein
MLLPFVVPQISGVLLWLLHCGTEFATTTTTAQWPSKIPKYSPPAAMKCMKFRALSAQHKKGVNHLSFLDFFGSKNRLNIYEGR